MRSLALLITLFIASAAHGQQICDLAPEWRQQNWTGYQHNGSCGHASTISALRWLQEFEKADSWKSKYSSGENFPRHLQRLQANGISFIETHDGDRSIFQTAATLRRMVIVYWKEDTNRGPKGHILDVVGFDDAGNVLILNNNHTRRLDEYEQRKWYDSWAKWSGCAIVILSGSPPPPVPE